jgi:hypothetical protein
VLAESGGEDEIAAAEAGNNAAELDQDVGGSPEGVAADAFVPGDVPDAADNAASDGEEIAPDVPGDRKSSSGDALSGASPESRRKGESASHGDGLQSGEQGAKHAMRRPNGREFTLLSGGRE